MKKTKESSYPIDLVITWVDGSDPVWLKEREKYISFDDKRRKDVAGDERYLDDGLLKYQFRGVEKYLPWINKIHFVTFGHLPQWLNTKHPKLHIVNHKDFIPEKYLPTFNSNPIVLNLHRIPGLSEHFIFANDDMYFIDYLKKEHFFKNGFPCDMAVQETIDAYKYLDTFSSIMFNNMTLLNSVVNKKDSQKKYFFKWFNPSYGFKHLYKTSRLFPFNLFTGIYEVHTPCPYLRSSFEYLWTKFSDQFDFVCKHKFRSCEDCSEYLIRDYQLASGAFVPFNRDKIGVYRVMSSHDLNEIILKQKKKMICINYFNSKKFAEIEKSFNYILNKKSGFEK